MDGNSIITQVAQNATASTPYESDVETTTPFRTATTSNNRKKRKSLFRTLLCCFTSRHEENKFSSSNENNSLVSNTEKFLLPQVRNFDIGKKCLIIDLDETLVHSSFKPVSNADFVVPVEIEGITHQVYVLKRPYVDEFLQKMGELFECILFTASLAKYAQPVVDLLDKWDVFRGRLFREACVYYRGNYVKDLSKLGRALNTVIICDNSPASYIFHPDNAVPVSSWFDDPNDSELMDLIPFMEKLAKTDDIYSLLKQGSLDSPEVLPNNSLYLQETQKIINQNGNDQIQLEQSLLINRNSSQSSFNRINYMNNFDENSSSNSQAYTVNEASVILSVDVTSSIKKYQTNSNDIVEQ